MVSGSEKISVVVTLIAGAALCAASLIPPDTLDSGIANPLPRILLIMGGVLLLKASAYFVFKETGRRRMVKIMQTWIDTSAEILESSETGSRYNRQPVVKLTLAVRSAVHGEYRTEIRRIIPTGRGGDFTRGKIITVKENPDKPGRVYLLDKQGGNENGYENND